VVVSQEKGVHGNTVTQMLVDPQGVDANIGATGMVAMLYFSEDGRQVQVEYYSTVREQYFIPENQFSFELAVVGAQAPATEPDEPTDPPVTEPETPVEQPEDPAEPEVPATEPQGETKAEDNTMTVVLGVICAVEAIAIIALIAVVLKKKK
jgi:hypothetical protein